MDKPISLADIANVKGGGVSYQVIPIAELEQELQSGDIVYIQSSAGLQFVEYDKDNPPDNIQSVLSAVIITRFSLTGNYWKRKGA